MKKGTGIVLGYVFIFAYCSVADASSSDKLLTSLMMPLLDLVSIIVFIIARGLLAFAWPTIEKQVIAALVDTRREELGDTSTLGSRMRNQYRIVCEIAMKELWTKKQFIDVIKQTTNEMIKNEIEKEENGKLVIIVITSTIYFQMLRYMFFLCPPPPPPPLS